MSSLSRENIRFPSNHHRFTLCTTNVFLHHFHLEPLQVYWLDHRFRVRYLIACPSELYSITHRCSIECPRGPGRGDEEETFWGLRREKRRTGGKRRHRTTIFVLIDICVYAYIFLCIYTYIEHYTISKDPFTEPASSWNRANIYKYRE